MPYVLAVDGGNSKTIALVAALDGSILGAGRGGNGDIYNSFDANTRGLSNVDYALANITDAVMQALQAAQVQQDEIVASVFNLAGADWPEDFVLLRTAMQDRGFGQTIQIQNDAMGILHSGSPDNVGVSVVCGTGGATGARGRDGRVWHASFWQLVGGSVDLSQQAFNAVLLAELGIAEPTILKRHVLELFGVKTVEEALHLRTNHATQTSGAPRIDSLTALLLDEADAGDPVSQRIVRKQGKKLGAYANVAAQRVGIEHTPFTLVLSGGVLRHPSSLLVDTIIERVRETSPDIQPVRPVYEPIIGVLFSALSNADVTIDDVTHERLQATHPDAMLFETQSRYLVPKREL